MPAGLGLCLWLGLSHHGGAERVHHSWLAGPRGGLGNVSRRPRGGAWAARVKGRGAAMETSPVVSTGPNTAVAQVHWQSLLVMVVGWVAATTVVAAAAADSSAGCGQSTGALHGAARILLKGQGARGLWSWVMDMVDEVVSAAVAVTVTVLRDTGLLRGRRLQAA